MDVKRFLKNILDERRELAALEQKRTELETALLPKAIRYDRERVQTSPGDMLAEIAAKCADIERKEMQHRQRLAADYERAQALIYSMPTATYRTVLELRYLRGKTWEEIALLMHFSESHVKSHLHGAALEEARKLWGHDTS